MRWVELFSHSLQFNATPLSIAEVFKRQLEGHPRAWIFTSATLSVRGEFRHYTERHGARGRLRRLHGTARSTTRSQALLYVPEGMPEPNSEGYTEAVVAAALPRHPRRRRAHVLPLHVAARDARCARDAAGCASSREGLDFPILVQGDGPKNDLLERFRKLGNAVLLGSQTFWEGVDVRGPALSVVVIDRLPFAPPDDPVLAARIDWMNRSGRNAFMEYQVPEAVITLKQGAGRLIRDETDRGVLMICDHAPGLEALWQAHLAKPAADEAHAPAGGGGGVFRVDADTSGGVRRGSGLGRARLIGSDALLTDLASYQADMLLEGVELVGVRERHADLRHRAVDAFEPLQDARGISSGAGCAATSCSRNLSSPYQR